MQFYCSLADVDILYSDSLSRNVGFTCLMFVPEISNRMVSVNGKHPWKTRGPVGKHAVGPCKEQVGSGGKHGRGVNGKQVENAFSSKYVFSSQK